MDSLSNFVHFVFCAEKKIVEMTICWFTASTFCLFLLFQDWFQVVVRGVKRGLILPTKI